MLPNQFDRGCLQFCNDCTERTDQESSVQKRKWYFLNFGIVGVNIFLIMRIYYVHIGLKGSTTLTAELSTGSLWWLKRFFNSWIPDN